MREEPLDCSVVLAKVHRFLDGELSEGDADQLRLHIDACEHCLDEVDVVATMKALVKRCCQDQHAPDSLRSRIISQFSASVSGARSGSSIHTSSIHTSSIHTVSYHERVTRPDEDPA